MEVQLWPDKKFLKECFGHSPGLVPSAELNCASWPQWWRVRWVGFSVVFRWRGSREMANPPRFHRKNKDGRAAGLVKSVGIGGRCSLPALGICFSSMIFRLCSPALIL